ncbi:hypothetical protein GUJ93_ZPchr0002g26327 [Zizania palustris]|uniref:Uncharacterized protein n=1 Tax=Zizania palustris TaxID=103762 RepID=A0A8J5ST49_ZIZPA|nr:hypothetical protein GUJ93_ZPchr0002g26327 [Zizania palustris]
MHRGGDSSVDPSGTTGDARGGGEGRFGRGGPSHWSSGGSGSGSPPHRFSSRGGEGRDCGGGGGGRFHPYRGPFDYSCGGGYRGGSGDFGELASGPRHRYGGGSGDHSGAKGTQLLAWKISFDWQPELYGMDHGRSNE